MKHFTAFRALAAVTLAGGLLAASAAVSQPEPDATIHFGGDSVAFIAGVNWGGGSMEYHGERVPLSVNGLGVGAIGASHYSAEGEVFHLHHRHDIEGTYTAVNAQATAGAGAGVIDMQNEHGVEIRVHSTSEGLELSLAPTGMRVKIK
jgi:hypothetical protein